MGMFDDITGKVREQMGGKDAGLMKGVMEMLSNRQTGGLNGIIESFRQKGMGDIISSWISTGPNKSITPEQIKEGLGNERTQQLAAKAGMSTDEAATKLSQQLPDVVDKATPDGNIPEGGILDKSLDFLKSKLNF